MTDNERREEQIEPVYYTPNTYNINSSFDQTLTDFANENPHLSIRDLRSLRREQLKALEEEQYQNFHQANSPFGPSLTVFENIKRETNSEPGTDPDSDSSVDSELSPEDMTAMQDTLDKLAASIETMALSGYTKDLPIFKGEEGAKGLRKFFRTFNEIGTALGMDEDRLATLLPLHLKGKAKAVYDQCTDTQKQDWTVITTELTNHFTSSSYLDAAQAEVMTLKMGSNESPTMFSQRIKIVLAEAYPNDKNFQDSMKRPCFCNGLSENIKQNLLLLGPLAANYDTLVENAERVFDVLKMENNSFNQSHLVQKVSHLVNSLSGIMNKNEFGYGNQSNSVFENMDRKYGYRNTHAPKEFDDRIRRRTPGSAYEKNQN